MVQEHFNEHLETAVAGTPFSVDMLAAIAQQETGYIWAPLVERKLPTRRILALCVGDTPDSDRDRNAFPETKSDLLAAPRGDGCSLLSESNFTNKVGSARGASKMSFLGV